MLRRGLPFRPALLQTRSCFYPRIPPVNLSRQVRWNATAAVESTPAAVAEAPESIQEETIKGTSPKYPL